MHTSPITLKHSIVGEPNKPSYSYRNYCMHLCNYTLCDTYNTNYTYIATCV